ncbi:unnamed protein product [Polarella glacialis]|uniref:Uncharacterized protein n=1 Tax=Polarella glacialis TaxID=89957 RepID=A0A813DG88_POLGL|nr:unnamed protein product [Polarella glacialis]CAE8715888.1 unnamed protein product [Polarella glacialis]
MAWSSVGRLGGSLALLALVQGQVVAETPATADSHVAAGNVSKAGPGVPVAPLFLRLGDLRRLKWHQSLGGEVFLGGNARAFSRNVGLRKLLLRLHGDRPARRCGTCAVVGAAGSLQRDNEGTHIDSHDCVFRVNLAPVQEFLHMVGEKYTFHFSGMPSLPGLSGETAKLANQQLLLARYSKLASNLSVTVLFDERGLQKVLEFVQGGEMGGSQLRVLHPMQLEMLCRELGYCSYGGEPGSLRPSTGLITIFVAQQLCATPPVVFGFDANSLPFHYYDPQDDHVCDAIRLDRLRGQGGRT